MASSSSLLQLKACLKKNIIEKKRNIRVTYCEFFSHLILIIVLLQGYNLSKILQYDSATYTLVNVQVPPPFLKGFSSSGQVEFNYAKLLPFITSILKGPLITPGFDEYVTVSKYLSSIAGSYGGLATQTSQGRKLSNLLFFGDLHFAPAGDTVNSFIKYMNSTYTTFDSVTYYIHDSEGDAVNYILNHLSSSTFALIVFRQVSPEKVNYVIRQNYTVLPNTNDAVNYFSVGLDTTYQDYLLSGFLTLQKTVDIWAFQQTYGSNCSAPPPDPVLIPYPTYAYNQNPFYSAVGFLLGLALVMSTLYPLARFVKSIVEEKETKMREIMKIMGLRDWVHQLSWFIMGFVLFLWIAVSTTYLTGTSFLKHSDKILLFAYFFLFFMSEITYGLLMTVFFYNSKLAAIVAPVVLFASILPRYIFLNTSPNEETIPKILTCLLSPSAFAFGADIIANYESTNVGVQFNNWTEGNVNFLLILGIMLLDFFIYGLLALYLDQVIPHEYGVAKHPLFFIDRYYWFPRKPPANYQSISSDVESNNDLDLPEMQLRADGTHDPNVEPISAELAHQANVCIRDLVKRYPDGKLAVKKLSLSMLEGQITCLLGHNGAGKTTTISALTGLIEVTGGEVSIYGRSLKYDLPVIRQMTGVCPQHNVLSPSLTVWEHLHFFGNIKGIGGIKVRDAIEKVIAEVGLTEKRHYLASTLSGGMKRKLSLAIALIGDPKFVLLDEPTSGMDPYSRRSTWEMLQKCKAGRVVLLTTHFMEEADTLADRIAIMSEGRLRCSGTSLFLKTRFGAGYLLSIAKTQSGSSVDNICEEVQAVVTEAKLSSAIAGEVVFQLPISAVTTFPDLFTKLKDQAVQLGISSYGISITTLEQVFISLAREARLSPVEDTEEDNEDLHDMLSGSRFQINSLLHDAPLALVSSFRFLYRAFIAGGISINRIFTVNHEESAKLNQSHNSVSSSKLNDRGSMVHDEEELKGKDIEMLTISRNVTTEDIIVVASAVVVPSNRIGDDDEEVKESKLKEDSSTSYLHNAGAKEGNYGVIPQQIVEPISTTTTKEDTIEGGFNNDGTSSGSFTTQVKELFRKRYIIASRDMKGMFFQIIFPAIQIVLILFILTININPAGHTLIMNGDLFKRYGKVTPTILTAGPSDALYRDQLSLQHGMTITPVNTTNSTQTSDYLLNPKHYTSNRFGAYQFKDSIPVNVTVNWEWVRQNLPHRQNINISQVNLFVQKFDGNFSLNSLLPQTFTIDLASLFSFANLTRFDKLLDRFDNSTSNLITIDSIGQIFYNKTSQTISVKNFSISIPTSGLPTIDITIPSLTIPLANLTNLLPHGQISYFFNVPAPRTVLHNATASAHAIAAFRGELVDSAFRQCYVNSQPNTDDINIQEEDYPPYLIKNHPLPITLTRTIQIKVILSILTSLFVLVPLCYIPASFVSFIVKERVSKSKHLQIVSSVSPHLYWLATYLWDLLLFSILDCLLLAAFFGFGADTAAVFINSSSSTLCLFGLFFLFGASSIPISYLYSFAFENFSTAQISIMAINFFTGFVFVMAYYVMSSVEQTKHFASQIVWFFRLFPPYNIGEGLITMATVYYTNTALGRHISLFGFNQCGRNLIFLAGEAVFYFTVILLSEWSPLLQVFYRMDRYRAQLIGTAPALIAIDEDVEREAKQLESADPNDYAMLVRGLVKTYPPSFLGGPAKHAVRKISFGCPNGERFGLLGINGAGKTTTLGILTSDQQLTEGEVFIGGKPLSDPITKRMVGYCPQVDPLLELMNGFETLQFFGRIRGLPEDLIQKRVPQLIHDMGLQNFANKPCGTYSGGNKRKLSLAVALIGDPRVLFLDEPSTGMDPEARRQMWTVIEKISANRSVILVSHSMEEVEALCTRLGVMVSGRMQCIGSVQHLKGRFGGDYQIEVRSHVQTIQDCEALCKRVMPGAKVVEQHGGYIRMEVQRGVDLAMAFRELENNKNNLQIYDYSISQCSLEQIFIQFAREQEEEKVNVLIQPPSV